MTSVQPRQHLYRQFLHNLQRIPDRQVWKTILPKFRVLLEDQIVADQVVPLAETSRAASLRAERAKRHYKRATKELHQLQAATACQPHALLRLLEKAYGIRGSVKHELIRSILASSPAETGPTTHRRTLPACLLPFKPDPLPPRREITTRLDKSIKPTAVRKAALREWERDWAKVKVPIILPIFPGGPKTGWEGTGVIEELRRHAALNLSSSFPSVQSPNSSVDGISLPPQMERIFPSARTPNRILPTYKSPPPSHTRQQPQTWSFPHRMTPRLLRRTYRKVWNSLVWSRPSNGSTGAKWEACTFEELISWSIHSKDSDRSPLVPKRKTRKEKPGRMGGNLSMASEEDLKWIGS